MLTQNPALKRILKTSVFPLCVLVLTALLQALDSAEWLRYQRDFIQTGQGWRVLTGHFVHLGWSHWLLNSVGLVLIYALFQPCFKRWEFAIYLLAGSLLVSLCLYIWSPHVIWYVGLSGVLHTVFVAGLLAQLRVQPGLSLMILSAVIAKLVWEQLYGPLPGSEESAGGPVVVVAHSYGAACGLLLFFILRLKLRPKAPLTGE